MRRSAIYRRTNRRRAGTTTMAAAAALFSFSGCFFSRQRMARFSRRCSSSRGIEILSVKLCREFHHASARARRKASGVRDKYSGAKKDSGGSFRVRVCRLTARWFFGDGGGERDVSIINFAATFFAGARVCVWAFFFCEMDAADECV